MTPHTPIGKSIWNLVTLLLLLQEFIGGAIAASDDITNIWYFGCRWFGGTVNKLSCNCTPDAEELYMQRYSIPAFDTSIIEINDCAKVRFGAEAVSDLKNLRRVSLNNIQSIVFESNSLNWVGYRNPSINQEERFDLGIPSLKVFIKDSTVANVYSHSFVGRINEINLENVQVLNLEAFAFSNLLQLENLLFANVRLHDVKPQAFKKFGTEFLTLDGVVADYLPSRTFSNVTVYRSFTIRNSHFHTLRPGTFIINNPAAFSITNTFVEQLEGEAFRLTTTGDVIFRNNTVNDIQDHAFMGIALNTNEVSSGRVMNIDANTIGRLERHSLDVRDEFESRITNLYLNRSCECESVVTNLGLSDYQNEIRCLSSDGDFVTVREFKTQNCSILSGYYTIVIAVCVVILVVSLVAISFYVYYMLVYRRQKYGCGKRSKPPMSLIVPDGRTYKETELHVIVEKADLLTTDL